MKLYLMGERKSLILEIIATVSIFALCGLMAVGFLVITGCDEGMQVVGPVITEPTEPVEPTEPTTNGDVKQPDPVEPTEPSEPIEPEPVEPVEPEPTPEPTIAITVVTRADDGSVTVSGTSADVPEGTIVSVTIGDAVSATATVDSAGAWTVTIPAAEAKALTAGTVTVTATAKAASATGSLVVPEQVSEEDQLQEEYRQQYESYNLSEEAVERLVNYEIRKKESFNAWNSGKISNKEASEILAQLYEEAYGISHDYAFELLKIYVEETGEKHLFGGWDLISAGIAYLTVKEANPEAEGEAFEELFRQAAREGTISISSFDI